MKARLPLLILLFSFLFTAYGLDAPDKEPKEKEKKHLFRYITKGAKKEKQTLGKGALAILPIPPLGKIIRRPGKEIIVSQNGQYYGVIDYETYALFQGNQRTHYPQASWEEGWWEGVEHVYHQVQIYSSQNDTLLATVPLVREDLTLTNTGHLIARDQGGRNIWDIYDKTGNRTASFLDLHRNFRGDQGIGRDINSPDSNPRWLHVDFQTGRTKELTWFQPSYFMDDKGKKIPRYDFLYLDSGHILQVKAGLTREDLDTLIKYDLDGNVVKEKKGKWGGAMQNISSSFVRIDGQLYKIDLKQKHNFVPQVINEKLLFGVSIYEAKIMLALNNKNQTYFE
ncbi:MAG: hypothetical protein D6785_09240, partial [Planctomycetota bacterium]